MSDEQGRKAKVYINDYTEDLLSDDGQTCWVYGCTETGTGYTAPEYGERIFVICDRHAIMAGAQPQPRQSSFVAPTPPFAWSELPRSDAIDAAHLERQRQWSIQTFGPAKRTLGVLDHIREELTEIEADPDDLGEWVDVIILAFDGAWRHGWEPQQIIDAIKAKQAKNEARVWPDWREWSEDEAIEHDRSGES